MQEFLETFCTSFNSRCVQCGSMIQVEDAWSIADIHVYAADGALNDNSVAEQFLLYYCSDCTDKKIPEWRAEQKRLKVTLREGNDLVD